MLLGQILLASLILQLHCRYIHGNRFDVRFHRRRKSSQLSNICYLLSALQCSVVFVLPHLLVIFILYILYILKMDITIFFHIFFLFYTFKFFYTIEPNWCILYIIIFSTTNYFYIVVFTNHAKNYSKCRVPQGTANVDRWAQAATAPQQHALHKVVCTMVRHLRG